MYKEYKYLYETHLHTNMGSACANNTGKEMAKAAKEYGYSGIIVTEHNWGGNTSIDKSLDWVSFVNELKKGYEDAKAFGAENDLDVFWGYEAGFLGTEFLIYGVSPDTMCKHPELQTESMEEHNSIVRSLGGFVVHAHPYREEWYIPEIRLLPDYVDAIEGINATHSNKKSLHHNNKRFDTLAVSYANKHNLPITAGSDVHSTEMFGGGVLFKKRISSINEYIDLIKAGDYLLTNGDIIYDRFGKEIES